jgi:hypothetical protein
MWKNVAALLAGALSAAVAAFTGAFSAADAAGVVGTDPVKVALFGIAVVLVTRGANWAIAKLG